MVARGAPPLSRAHWRWGCDCGIVPLHLDTTEDYVVVLSWLLALAGAAVAFIVGLAGAMKTVPSLSFREAIVGVPLPALAVALAAWRLFGRPRPAATGRRPLIAAGLPLLLALLTFFYLAVSYLDQPGGPR